VFYLAAPGWLRKLRFRIGRRRRQKKFGELTELNDYLRRISPGVRTRPCTKWPNYFGGEVNACI
jgi:hypothetical protein